ncbi:MAG: leucine-rich repeat protein, partial [Oscillospiraceae bacterium]|nr:leucine-rich repeat protein [Oscillospiraceae bacterium]
MKRFLTPLLCLLLCVCLAPAAAAAGEVVEAVDSGICGENAEWTLYDNGELVIEGSGPMYDYTGIPVYIASAAGCPIQKVTIREGITAVGDRSFCDLGSLTEAALPYSLTRIGVSAFENTGLETVVIPSGVETVGAGAFARCSGLEAVWFSGPLPEAGDLLFLYDNCTVYYPAWEDYGSLACIDFGGSVRWTGVDIGQCGDNVYWEFDERDGSLWIGGCGAMWSFPDEGPGYGRFADQIKSVGFDDRITLIGSWAFYKAYPALERLELGGNIQQIGVYAFSGCGSLKQVVFPDSLQEISGWAFEDCTGLKAVAFNGTAPLILHEAFKNVSATAYYFDSAVNGDTSWTESERKGYGGTLLWTPGGVCGEDTYWNYAADTGLLRIFGEGEMYDNRFESSTYRYITGGVTEVWVDEGVTKVGMFSFVDNSVFDGLTRVVLPKSLKAIDGYAFRYRDNLSEIVFRSDVPVIADNAFTGVEADVHYPVSLNWEVNKFDYGGNLHWYSYEPAAVTAQPKAVSAVLGATAKFTVTAAGEGLTYEWQYRAAGASGWTVYDGTGAYSRTMKVTASAARSGTAFRCVVSDRFGNAAISKSAKLSVVIAPPTDVTAKGLTSGGIKVSWTLSDGATKYNVYRKVAGGSWENIGYSRGGSLTDTTAVA